LISARFHQALASAITAVAHEVGLEHVALSGGCFQNRLLTTRSVEALRSAGHQVLLHRRVPPGDGGIALGQIATAAARLSSEL
jgi:hydrogenase maturation protein HypF